MQKRKMSHFVGFRVSQDYLKVEGNVVPLHDLSSDEAVRQLQRTPKAVNFHSYVMVTDGTDIVERLRKGILLDEHIVLHSVAGKHRSEAATEDLIDVIGWSTRPLPVRSHLLHSISSSSLKMLAERT
jgi:hypothetical protein